MIWWQAIAATWLLFVAAAWAAMGVTWLMARLDRRSDLARMGAALERTLTEPQRRLW